MREFIHSLNEDDLQEFISNTDENELTLLNAILDQPTTYDINDYQSGPIRSYGSFRFNPDISFYGD
ncbi:hypothetical protein FACS189472_11730 [Alphaproteobacteria bacterium]|nr:hypothetical protein FACS189472_11730 [Alphaproteobacteria bacterium]